MVAARRAVPNDGRPTTGQRMPPTPPSSGGQRPRSGSTPAPKLSQARFDPMKVAPAFSSGSGSRFAAQYTQGNLPCHIDHGCNANRISWDVPTTDLLARRGMLLALCAEGLRETRHPYATVARLAFADLAQLDADPLTDDELRRVMAAVRAALTAEHSAAGTPKMGASRSSGVFEAALMALRQIVQVEGVRLVPHLHLVIPPIGKHLFGKAHSEAIQATLRDLESFGGPDAAKAMRARGVSVGVT